MSMPLREIKGLSPDAATKLREMGVTDSDKLLAKVRTAAARKELAAQIGMAGKDFTEIVNRADLSRIKGVAGAFGDLLEQAGVDSVKELAGRVPDNLQKKLAEVNEGSKVSTRTPTLQQVTEWVAEAKTLPAVFE